MAVRVRLFPPNVPFVDANGSPTQLAEGWMRAIALFCGAAQGTIPAGSLGGGGSATTFLRDDGTFAVPDYPVGANPSAKVGTSQVNGTAATFMRSDAAPALDLTLNYTFTGDVATNKFGCNGKTPQGAYTVNAAVAGAAGGAYTGTEQTMINDLQALVNQMRSALIANGIAV